MAYRTMRSHEIAIDYFKLQMSLAWELNDTTAEIRSYDNLSQEYYYVGNIEKAKLYHERVFRGKIEAVDSIARKNNQMQNNFKRNKKAGSFAMAQTQIKGLDALDIGKRDNLVEQRQYDDEALLHETKNEETKFQQVINQTQRAQFENALYSDANQLADYKLQNKKSLLQAHNLLKLKSNDDRDHELARRRLLRNFTIASKDELEARRETYRPVNIKE